MINFPSWFLDRSVEFRTAGVLFRAELPFSDKRSTQKLSVSVNKESKELVWIIVIKKCFADLLISMDDFKS